jgi:hypothetical protein
LAGVLAVVAAALVVLGSLSVTTAAWAALSAASMSGLVWLGYRARLRRAGRREVHRLAVASIVAAPWIRTGAMVDGCSDDGRTGKRNMTARKIR